MDIKLATSRFFYIDMKKNVFLCYFLGIVLHLLFLTSLKTHVLNSFFCDATHRAGQASDFFTHYQASHNYWQGKSFYTNLTSQANKVVPYCYEFFRFFPSSTFLVGGLITSFAPWLAYVVWLVLNEFLLLVMCFYAWKLCPKRFHLSFLLAFGFTPLYVEFYMGQFSFIVAFFIFFMGYGFLQKKSWIVTLSFYGTVFIKYYGVIFLPFLVWNWKRHFYLFLGLIPLLAVTFFPYFSKYPEDLKSFVGAHALGGSHAGNLGLRAWLYCLGDVLTGTRQIKQIPDYTPPKIIPSHQRPVISRILYEYVWIFLFVLLGWRTISAQNRDPVILLSLWTIFFFLMSKDVWEHHYVVLIPIYLLYNIRENRSVVHWCFLFIALPTPFYSLTFPLPAYVDPEPYWSSFEVLFYHAIKPFAVLVLFFDLMFYSLRSQEPVLER